MLLAVNLTIGGNLLLFFVTQHRQIDLSVENALSVLEKKNIFISKKQLPVGKNRNVVVFERNLDTELQNIAEIFGCDCFGKSLGGGMMQYVSVKNDTALISNGGFCEITFNNSDKKQKNHVKYINAVLRRCLGKHFGFEAASTENPIKIRQTINGQTVFNSDLNLYVDVDSLLISGRLAFGDMRETDETSKSNAELLIYLVQNFSDCFSPSDTINVSQINAGILASTGQNGSCIFTPVWQIYANDRLFYLDTATGSFVDAE